MLPVETYFVASLQESVIYNVLIFINNIFPIVGTFVVY